MRVIRGRLLGAVLGFFLASLLGAVVGFIIGYYWYDRPRARRDRMEQAASSFNSQSGHANRELIIHTFTLMGYVARGAGAINQEHIRKASELMDQMGLRDEASRHEAIAAFNEGKGDHFDFAAVMEALRRHVSKNEMIGAYILEIQIMIAVSDAVLTDEEYRRLSQIAAALGQSEATLRSTISLRMAQMQFHSRFSQAYGGAQGGWQQEERRSSYSYGQQRTRQEDSRQHQDYGRSQEDGRQHQDYGRRQEYQGSGSGYSSEQNTLQGAYSILGVTENATPAEIKKAHKRMMLKYHPDRLAAQGLPPEMVKLYTEKAQDIQAAFDLIKKTRGFS